MQEKNVFEHVVAHNGDTNFEPSPPAMATGCAPGSHEKIRIMKQRLEHGESLFHQDDMSFLGSRLTSSPILTRDEPAYFLE